MWSVFVFMVYIVNVCLHMCVVLSACEVAVDVVTLWSFRCLLAKWSYLLFLLFALN